MRNPLPLPPPAHFQHTRALKRIACCFCSAIPNSSLVLDTFSHESPLFGLDTERYDLVANPLPRLIMSTVTQVCVFFVQIFGIDLSSAFAALALDVRRTDQVLGALRAHVFPVCVSHVFVLY